MCVPLIFDIGGGELLVILLFALLFFGSKGIPDVARTMGRTLRQLRDATADVQREIEKGASDVKKGFEEQRKTFRIGPPEQAVPQRPTDIVEEKKPTDNPVEPVLDASAKEDQGQF